MARTYAIRQLYGFSIQLRPAAAHGDMSHCADNLHHV
jgi:hypothetical protein